MLRAVGHGRRRLRQAADRRRQSSWNEITPCNLSLDRLAKAVKDGRARRAAATRWSSARSRSPTASPWATRACTSRWCRREVIADSRRDGHAGRAPRRLGAAGRLRQVAARHADGRRAPRPGQRVPLRRLDHARLGQAVGRHREAGHDHRRLRGRRRLRARTDEPRGRRPRSSAPSAPARAPAAACTPPTRWLSAAEALGMSLPGSAAPAGHRPPPRRLRAPLRRGRGRAAARRASPPATS